MIRIRDPPRMQTGNHPQQTYVPEKTQEEIDEKHRKAWQTEYYINLVSAIFSILGLIVLLTQDRALRFIFKTWVSFIPSVRHARSVESVPYP